MAELDDQTIDLGIDLSDVGAELSSVTKEIEEALRVTGEVIAQELKSAAKSGESDFSAMARTIAAELAALAVERVFTGASTQEAASPLTVNVAMPAQPSNNSSGSAASANAIAALVAQAVRRGSRFL